MKRSMMIAQAAGGLVLGLGLCVFLVQQTDLTAEHRERLLANINWPAMWGVFALTFLMMWTGARKWQYLDSALDDKPPQSLMYYMRHCTLQSWLAQLLPSTVAIIAGRAVATHGGGERNWKRGFKNAMIDQLGELYIVVAFIPASIWQIYSGCGLPEWLLLGIVITVAGAFVGKKLAPRYFLTPALFWSFWRLVTIQIKLVLGSIAFALPLENAHILYAMPIATLTALVPITPGNLGLAEWGWTYALLLWGVDKSVSALYALSYRVLVLVMQTLALPLAFLKSRAR